MKTKLIASLLLGSSFLLANSIVGTWGLDKAKAKALQDSYSKDKQAQFLIAIMATNMEKITFRKDGSCKIGVKNRVKCWKKLSDSHYTVYEEDGSDRGAKVKVADAKQMEVIIDNPKFVFAYTRIKKEN